MMETQNPEVTRQTAEDDLGVKSSDEAYPSRNQSTLTKEPPVPHMMRHVRDCLVTSGFCTPTN